MKKLSFFLVLFLAFFATNVQAQSLESKLRGKILLQVEANGEAWYLSPLNEKRYYMGRPADAFRLMNELGIGISNQDLNKIPVVLDDIVALDSDLDGLPDFMEDAYGTDKNNPDTDGDGFIDGLEVKGGFNPNGPGKLKIDVSFAEKHKGKIFLQVENKGEAWYINPGDAKRYYLGRPSDAFKIMRQLGLGIKNSDIEKIAKMTDVPQNTLLEDLKKQKNIKKFASEAEFAKFLEDNNTVGDYSDYLYRSTVGATGPSFAMGDTVEASWSAQADTITTKTGLGDYSTTNIQVAGVDEADIIKTDGNYVYALVAKTLFIISSGPEAKILSQIEFKDQPQNIYLSGDRLVVFGRDTSHRDKELYKVFVRKSSFTFFKIFDISDRTSPKQIKDLNIEGYYSNSRMIGDYVYFISNNRNFRYYEAEPVIPRIISDDVALKTSCPEKGCLNPSIYYFDYPYSSYNAVSINAINIKDVNEEIKGDIYILASGQNFYVSEKNIYLTYTKYISEYQLMMDVSKELIRPRLSAKDQELIVNIEKTENAILSPQEKQSKILGIISLYSEGLSEEKRAELENELIAAMKKRYEDISKELEKTVIHKIAINKGELSYQNNGEVNGYVLNQFSMDESSDGYFRIATTKRNTWSIFDGEPRLSYNNLFVLDKDLKQVGSLEKLAEDESIKSVRFMQDRAYMVTFKQIDPLFVIDLKDATSPKVLGELKIPGYSDYLHPYNDHLLIGLGKDAYENEQGRTVTGGIKLSLFDVSNVSSPKELDSYIMGESGSHSPALRDHKAFYFDFNKKLIGIPVALREKDSSRFNGALIVEVDENGFNLRGRISHKEKTSEVYRYTNSNVKRILHIGDNLYTFSDSELKINKIADLTDITSVSFQSEEDDITIKTVPTLDDFSDF